MDKGKNVREEKRLSVMGTCGNKKKTGDREGIMTQERDLWAREGIVDRRETGRGSRECRRWKGIVEKENIESSQAEMLQFEKTWGGQKGAQERSEQRPGHKEETRVGHRQGGGVELGKW